MENLYIYYGLHLNEHYDTIQGSTEKALLPARMPACFSNFIIMWTIYWSFK